MSIDAVQAGHAYAAARRLDTPAPAAETDAGFADALEAALRQMETALRTGETRAAEGMAGTADLQSVVEALSATEMALETAVVIRDRVVEAYQEIMRMPV